MSRVGIIGYNSIDYIKKVIEIWENGDAVVLIDPMIPIDKQYEIIKTACVNYCFIDDRIYEKNISYKNAKMSFEVFNVTCGFTELCTEQLIYKEKYTDDEAVIIFSSGTTGISKGVILTHKAINVNADAIIEYMGINKKDTLYIAKPFSHSSTFTGEIVVSLKVGNNLVLSQPIVPPRVILSNLSKFKCTHVCVNPYLLRIITAEQKRKCYDLSHLRRIYVSGSRLSDNIWLDAKNTFNNTYILNVYGLTEAGPRVSVQSDDEKTNTVGKPIKDVEIIITDDKGHKMSESEMGIVSVKTPSKMKGYINSDQVTPVYKDWLNTGDLGYIDENGCLHIVDRLSEVIVINSHNIIPSSVEESINQIDGVDNSCVLKVSTDYDDVLCCVYTGNEIPSIEIRNKLSKCFLNYEIPSIFKHIEAMPMTPTQKIDRKEIKNKYSKELKLKIRGYYNERKNNRDFKRELL